jgi:hypothetical protein
MLYDDLRGLLSVVTMRWFISLSNNKGFINKYAMRLGMLEEIISTVRNGIIIQAAGIAMAFSGCVFAPVTSVIINPMPIADVNTLIDDYSTLSWQEAIVHVQAPVQAQHYLDTHLTQSNAMSGYIPGLVSWGERSETFRINHTKRVGRCLDYASAAAALLSDNGYPPLILEMQGNLGYHAVYLYRTPDGFWRIRKYAYVSYV